MEVVAMRVLVLVDVVVRVLELVDVELAVEVVDKTTTSSTISVALCSASLP